MLPQPFKPTKPQGAHIRRAQSLTLTVETRPSQFGDANGHFSHATETEEWLPVGFAVWTSAPVQRSKERPPGMQSDKGWSRADATCHCARWQTAARKEGSRRDWLANTLSSLAFSHFMLQIILVSKSPISPMRPRCCPPQQQRVQDRTPVLEAHVPVLHQPQPTFSSPPPTLVLGLGCCQRLT